MSSDESEYVRYHAKCPCGSFGISLRDEQKIHDLAEEHALAMWCDIRDMKWRTIR